MENVTVVLTDGTVGEVAGNSSVKVGDEVTVSLHDENGLPISVSGIVEEVL